MSKRTSKEKNPEIMGFKDKFGATILVSINGVGAIFMSTMFMTFLTDYAGLGSWGAALATAVLFFSRFLDAIDDPLQSMIMDNAKPTKHGKYKPFFLLSIIMTTVGIVALYSMPSFILGSKAMVAVWIILFYLVYDIGVSFFNINLAARFMTTDASERGKLIVGPRVWIMVLSMFNAGLTAVAVSLQASLGSYNAAYRVVVTTVSLVSALLSLIGWFMIKERHIVENEETEQKVSFKDFFTLMKENDAMMINFFKQIFAGFIWTMLFAAPTYYIKWGLCADLTTGEVDMVKLGTYSIVVSLMMILPLLVGVIIANPIYTKVFKGNPVKMQMFDLLFEGVGGILLFVSHITGLVKTAPALFFVGMFIMATGIGIDFVPGSAIGMEIMDYTVYKTGKDRSAMSNALGNLLEKAQNALSSTIVGALLIAVGYNVDSVTGAYLGELSQMPSMLTGLAAITGLLPAILAIISVLIMRKYPITDKIRKEMAEMLNKETVSE